MRIHIAALLLSAGIVHAQSAAPSFTADGVVGSFGHAPLVPGMLVSIYGGNLGPRAGCTGKPDPYAKETPSPLLPDAGSINTLIYPRELCGVQVLFGDLPSGLLYVREGQINFKVPQEAPMEGAVRLRVVYQGQSSASVTLPFGLESLKLSLEAPAHVNGPVWLHIQLPSFPWYGEVNYPVSVQPDDFGCQEIEVRREGTLLPRIPVRVTGSARNFFGPPCGTIGVPGHAAQHKNRLPLHLQYRFDRPGTYEVRYTRRSGRSGAPPVYQSEWTLIEIQPAQPFAAPPAPQDPAEIIGDYLPSLLGFADDARLPLVAEFLYDSNDTVRRYAWAGLAYWPLDRIEHVLTDLLPKRGPSDVVVEPTFLTPAAADFILPGLQSANPTLLRGAIVGVARLLATDPPLSTEKRARVEDALIAAADNVLRDAVPQTRVDYASALGSAHDPRARDLLWSFVGRGLITEQSLICITWFKNPADLPRIASLLVVPNPADTKDRTYASLPYAFYHSYGDVALPVLESVLQKTGYVFVQTNCAEQLVLAGRKSGFAFIAQAIEQHRFYGAEMARFVQDRFPELRGADESKILAFVRSRQ